MAVLIPRYSKSKPNVRAWTGKKLEIMPYVAQDVVKKVKQIDLLTKNYEPHELVRVSGKIHTTKAHDSLKIFNDKRMRWSRGIGENSVLDYRIKSIRD